MGVSRYLAESGENGHRDISGTTLVILLFVLAAASIFYVLAGYPLLLALLARRRTRPIKKSFAPFSVSILVPVSNGERWLRAKLESLLAQNYPRRQIQIVVVSDGSTDGTDAIAAEFGPRGVELLRVPAGGKAAALNAGVASATGELLLLTDVRQPLDPESLRNMAACFGDPSVGAVSGQIVFAATLDRPPHEGLYWRYEKWIRRNLTRLDSLLVATGCIFAIRRELYAPLPPGSLVDDAFLPLSVVVKGRRVVYEPGAVAYESPASLEMEFSRKVRTLAGLYQLLRSHPALLGPANRLWLHFASYKLGRLLLPWALLVLAVSSFALPRWAMWPAVSFQALFYGLAALHGWIPAGGLRRISTVARTFVALMAASLCATSILFVPPAALWKQRPVENDSPVGSLRQ